MALVVSRVNNLLFTLGCMYMEYDLHRSEVIGKFKQQGVGGHRYYTQSKAPV